MVSCDQTAIVYILMENNRTLYTNKQLLFMAPTVHQVVIKPWLMFGMVESMATSDPIFLVNCNEKT